MIQWTDDFTRAPGDDRANWDAVGSFLTVSASWPKPGDRFVKLEGDCVVMVMHVNEAGALAQEVS